MESEQQNSDSDGNLKPDPKPGSDPTSQPNSDSKSKATLTNPQLASRGHLMCWVVAMINLIVIVICMIEVQPQLSQSFGSVLNLALLFLMWQGNGFARWIMVAIFSLLSTVLVILGAVQFNPLCLAVGVIFMVVPMLLMTASVNAWLAHQRAAWKAQIIEKIRKKQEKE